MGVTWDTLKPQKLFAISRLSILLHRASTLGAG